MAKHPNSAFRTAERQKSFQNPPTKSSRFPLLAAAVDPHIQSFDALLERSKLLEAGLRDIGTKVCRDARAGEHENRVNIKVREVFLDRAILPPTNKHSTTNREIYPSECRERHSSYKGKLRCRLEVQINQGTWHTSVREMGQLPIMLKSNRCHLRGRAPAQLIQCKEDSEELGGYFIVNGVEKVVRMLAVPRRNFPMAIARSAFVNRGPGYTEFGIQIRCVRPDQTSQSNVLHYLNDGNVTFRFSWRKNEYLVPVVMILKALVDTNDRAIFEGLAGRSQPQGTQSTFITERIELLLRTYKPYKCHTKHDARSYLGNKFRVVLGVDSGMSDSDAGTEFLRKIVLVHLGNVDVKPTQDTDKFMFLLFMIRKLYHFATGDCAADNPDAVSNHEILLPGFLYGMILKERFEEWLNAVQNAIAVMFEQRDCPDIANPNFIKFLYKSLDVNENIAGGLEYFLSTGNLTSPSGLDLQQTSGFTVMAEKINFYRFISHFRMVHRGSFFAQLKTTTVRKLLPESWGFLCPVHTPDGAPCGLLNHLSHECKITTQHCNVSAISGLLSQLGIKDFESADVHEQVVVQLDGRILGYCSATEAQMIADHLRHWKVQGHHGLSRELEIGLVPDQNGGPYAGLYIFSQPARLIRPVKHVALDRVDYIGPFEQPFLSIACADDDVGSDKSTYAEQAVTNILSIVANQTPFSDFNQSPRNMYQCQMAKQTMGTPATSLRYRSDNKTYLLQTGQTPVVRPPLNDDYGVDHYPNGTNAIVAVISYTGYDMDDAMIIAKSAHERGFGHGTIFKTKIINLADERTGRSSRSIRRFFGFAPDSPVPSMARQLLGSDGLPSVGSLINPGDPLCASHAVTHDPNRVASGRTGFINADNETRIHSYKDEEPCYIEKVTLIGSETGNEPLQAVAIQLRVPRAPVIGDKFSSRHGQKGVCSQKWPSVDMPFSESGIIPDVIINPHAFPSRMTIGMFVESLAGKSGALHGMAQDCSPWRFSEEDSAADFFGTQLRAAGYNYHGNEPMYSGVTGEEFAADIFIGVVYYQRLRHMVNDKFQVRTTGPVTALTGQPIKGRSKGGGIRVGEMERDALLAHGCAFLLQDRLLNCSDYRKEWICKQCGTFISTQPAVTRGIAQSKARSHKGTGIVRCRRCARRVEDVLSKGGEVRIGQEWEDGAGEKWLGGDNTTIVPVPGVLRYLDVELAAMGVKLSYEVGP